MNRGDRLKGFSIAPPLCAHNVIGDGLFQKGRSFSTLQRPVIPFPMEFLQVHETGLADVEPSKNSLRLSRPSVVPGTDHQIVPRRLGTGGTLQVLAIMSERTWLIGIVAAGDREDRQGELPIVGCGQVILVPVVVLLRVCGPLL